MFARSLPDIPKSRPISGRARNYSQNSERSLPIQEGVTSGLDPDRYVGVMTRTYRRFRRDISRADFQALAAIVAVEKAVAENNAWCAEEDASVSERHFLLFTCGQATSQVVGSFRGSERVKFWA